MVGGGYIVGCEVGGGVGKNTARDWSSPRWNSRRQKRLNSLILLLQSLILLYDTVSTSENGNSSIYCAGTCGFCSLGATANPCITELRGLRILPTLALKNAILLILALENL